MHAEAAPPPPLAAAADDDELPPEPRLLDNDAGHRAIELVVRQHESGCQLAVVRLVAALCKTRDAKAVLPVLRAMDEALAGHRAREVRKAYYELLIALHAQDAQLDEQSRTIVHASLLRGLSDPDDAPSEAAADGAPPEAIEEQPGQYDAKTGVLRPPLRAAMAHYWHTARLPPQLPPRLLACFTALYSSPTEREWVQVACDALLRVAADGAASAPPEPAAALPPHAARTCTCTCAHQATDRPTDRPTECPTACAPPWQHQRMSRYSSRRPSTRIAS